jgi:hypothetical protein
MSPVQPQTASRAPSRSVLATAASVAARRLCQALVGAAVLWALVVPSALADDTISVTVGADPTEEVPVAISVAWSSTTTPIGAWVTVKQAGGLGCAPSYAADAPNSDDVITGGSIATGSTSTNRTFSEPGDFTLCGYLQSSSGDTVPRKATGPIAMTVRSAKATVGLIVPPRVDLGKTFQLGLVTTTELARLVWVTIKPAGGRACEPNYGADAPASDDVLNVRVQGSQTSQNNVTASQTKGTYLLCAYVQESSSDAVPEATTSATFLVGPDPCLTARSALRKAQTAVHVAEASVTRNRKAWKRYSAAARHGSRAARRHKQSLARLAHSRYQSAVRNRAKARATLAKRQTAVTSACGG